MTASLQRKTISQKTDFPPISSLTPSVTERTETAAPSKLAPFLALELNRPDDGTVSFLKLIHLKTYLSSIDPDHMTETNRLDIYRILQQPDGHYAALLRKKLNATDKKHLLKRLLLYDELLDMLPAKNSEDSKKERAELQKDLKKCLLNALQHPQFRSLMLTANNAATLFYMMTKYSDLLADVLKHKIPEGRLKDIIHLTCNPATENRSSLLLPLLGPLTGLAAIPGLPPGALLEIGDTLCILLKKEYPNEQLDRDMLRNCVAILFRQLQLSQPDEPNGAIRLIIEPLLYVPESAQADYLDQLYPELCLYISADPAFKRLGSFITLADAALKSFYCLPSTAQKLFNLAETVFHEIVQRPEKEPKRNGVHPLPATLWVPEFKARVSLFYLKMADKMVDMESSPERYKSAEEFAEKSAMTGCPVPQQLAAVYTRMAQLYLKRLTDTPTRQKTTVISSGLAHALTGIKLAETSEGLWTLFQYHTLLNETLNAFKTLVQILRLPDNTTNNRLDTQRQKLSLPVLQTHLRTLIQANLSESHKNEKSLTRLNREAMEALPLFIAFYPAEIYPGLIDYVLSISSRLDALSGADPNSIPLITAFLTGAVQLWPHMTYMRYRQLMSQAVFVDIPPELKKNQWDIAEVKTALMAAARCIQADTTLPDETRHITSAVMPLLELQFGDPEKAHQLAIALLHSLKTNKNYLTKKNKTEFISLLGKIDYYQTSFHTPVSQCIAVYLACRKLEECLPYLEISGLDFSVLEFRHLLKSSAAFAAVHSRFNKDTQSLGATLKELNTITWPGGKEQVMEVKLQIACLLVYAAGKHNDGLALFHYIIGNSTDAVTTLLYLEAALHCAIAENQGAAKHLKNALTHAKKMITIVEIKNAHYLQLKCEENTQALVTPSSLAIETAEFTSLVIRTRTYLTKSALPDSAEALSEQSLFFKNLLSKIIVVPPWLFHPSYTTK